MIDERAFLFGCNGDELCGILHIPEQPVRHLGVLLVVGGPQYRVGSHRQFVLLARALSRAGIPVLRFDYRGMGDSTGTSRDFETVDDDITAAKELLFSELPEVKFLVFWGLCDAASANAFYAMKQQDRRIIGQVALNPWARTPEGEAEAYIRHYYAKRLFSMAFWRKVLDLKVDVAGAIKDFLHKFQQSHQPDPGLATSDRPHLPQRLFEAQTLFPGSTLLILSGQDLTAKEYEARVAESPEWQDWLSSERVTVKKLDDADHTFSRAVWREQVNVWTRDWIYRLIAEGSDS